MTMDFQTEIKIKLLSRAYDKRTVIKHIRAYLGAYKTTPTQIFITS